MKQHAFSTMHTKLYRKNLYLGTTRVNMMKWMNEVKAMNLMNKMIKKNQMSLDSSNWFNSKFQAYVFKALAGENDDVTNLFETEHNSSSVNSTFVEKPSATGLSNTIDKLLVVEQDFLKEKKMKLVKDHLEHEIDTYNVRTSVRKRNADIGTLQEDATAVFGRESNL